MCAILVVNNTERDTDKLESGDRQNIAEILFDGFCALVTEEMYQLLILHLDFLFSNVHMGRKWREIGMVR